MNMRLTETPINCANPESVRRAPERLKPRSRTSVRSLGFHLSRPALKNSDQDVLNHRFLKKYTAAVIFGAAMLSFVFGISFPLNALGNVLVDDSSQPASMYDFFSDAVGVIPTLMTQDEPTTGEEDNTTDQPIDSVGGGYPIQRTLLKHHRV